MRGRNPSAMWAYTPEIVLEKVLEYLGWRDRLSCSLVCQHWNAAFYAPSLWKQLILSELTFTRSRFNLYGGYRQEISHHLVQSYLGEMGACVQKITVLPNSNYFNLYGFIRVLFTFLEFFDDYPMPNLDTFELIFNCESHTPVGHMISGTGGHILEGLQRLLHDFQGLRSLTYNHLLLKTIDAHGVLEDLLTNNQESLRYLEVVNFTNQRYPIFTLAQFHGLRTLVLNPLNLNDDVAMMVAEKTRITRLIIVQDNYTPEEPLEPVSLAAWWQVKELNPDLRVQLCVRGPTLKDILIQENAPVDQVLYNSPLAISKPQIILQLVDEYRIMLQKYIFYGLPRKHGERSFNCRSDSSLVLLVRECPRLETLVINERVSTATLLLIAHEGKALKKFYVRRNAVILRCDWPKHGWSIELKDWIVNAAKDYSKTEQEVGKKLCKDWHMLTDKEFKRLNVF